MAHAAVHHKFLAVIGSHITLSNKVNAGANYVRLSSVQYRNIYSFIETSLSKSGCRGNR
jgi:hypothetical protein